MRKITPKVRRRRIIPPELLTEIDRPWEITPYMLEQEEKRRNSPYYNYGYNHTTGKVERIP